MPGPVPPSPERRPTILEAHGDRRVDDWFWLRDASDPSVVAHLESENAYADAVLARLNPLCEDLYREMVARIAETDLSVPVRHGPWWYYHRTEEGRDYAVHCRCPARPGEDPPAGTVAAAGEQVLFDENAMAEGLAFFQVGNLAISPGHRWLAYATDTSGAERYDLAFRWVGDGEAPRTATEVIPGTYYGLAWANDEATVFYTRVDEAMRPYQLWRHRLGSDSADDTLVLEEGDERFTLSVGRTKDGHYVVVALHSTTTSELHVVPADAPDRHPRTVEPRREGIEYTLEHHAGADGSGRFAILTNDGAVDFRLVVAPADEPNRERWTEVVPHRSGTRLDDIDVFDTWLVLAERLDGEPRLRLVASDEHPAVTWEGANPEPRSTLLRVEQSSLVTPRTVADVDLESGDRLVRKRQPVLGDFDPSRYRTARLWVDAPDGRKVPLSVVARVELLTGPDDAVVPAGAPAPCLLYGYGAYEHSVDPVFSSLRLSLLDRGFVFAIAHVRGGGELGRRWYEEGKLATKPHTFSDFLACARHLVDAGFTTPGRLGIRGGSAGGLLVGAVLNEAPELFGAAVAEVPFVDCLTTMLDKTLPLTVGEWEEWGNPVDDPVAYETMRAYSPYDNVRSTDERANPVRYPPLFVTAGLHDSRVGFWEPAKWVAKLRAANPDNRAVLRTELGAGHGGPSGRYDAWRDEARIYAFLIDALVGDDGSQVTPVGT